MKKVNISSPTRVDLAGGTLDLWPLYCFTGGAVTVNLAIDIQTYVQIEETKGEVILDSADMGISKTYLNLEQALKDPDPKFLLFRSVLSEIRPEGGFHLKTRSESPVGGGLGGSSSLMVSILRAFSKFSGTPPMDVHRLVGLCHNLEASILNTPTGTQDYYPAASGGLNILTYGFKELRQEVLPVSGTPFEKKFLLVNTGKSHHSGMNNFEVMKSAVAKDPTVIKALFDLKEVAEGMEEACRKEKWGQLSDLFRREYDARVRLAPAFTCPEIKQLDQVTREAGAEAIKICGAGGGGCVMVWCPATGRETISEACQNAGFKVLNARPVPPL